MPGDDAGVFGSAVVDLQTRKTCSWTFLGQMNRDAGDCIKTQCSHQMGAMEMSVSQQGLFVLVFSLSFLLNAVFQQLEADVFGQIGRGDVLLRFLFRLSIHFANRNRGLQHALLSIAGCLLVAG